MFHNIRRFKAGIEGGMLREGIWDFAKEHDIDWIGLNDHWLVVPRRDNGKWDCSGVDCPKSQRYRSSGTQAAEAKGYDTEGWGGEHMQWTIAQGLPGTNGPVGGTLLATRTGWGKSIL